MRGAPPACADGALHLGGGNSMEGYFSAAVAGLGAAGAYALLGVCVVFTYRLVSVVNFTGASIGAAGTFVLVVLHQAGLGVLPAAIIGLVAGTLTGMLIGSVMTRWFAQASASTKAAVNVALLVGIVSVGLRLTGGQHPKQFPDLFPGSAFSLADVQVTISALVALGVAAAFTLVSDYFLARTSLGLQLQALSENPKSAELLGIRVGLLSLVVWAVTGLLATFAMMIIAPARSPDFMSLSLLIIPALAAALVGAFRNPWMTFAGGMGIGILQGLTSNIPHLGQYRGTIPLLVILAVLLWTQRGARWDEAR